MICDECWLPHDPSAPECPKSVVLATIMPGQFSAADVAGHVPESVVVELFRLPLTVVVVLRSPEPFDTRPVVRAMKTWIEPVGPLGGEDEEEGWQEDDPAGW